MSGNLKPLYRRVLACTVLLMAVGCGSPKVLSTQDPNNNSAQTAPAVYLTKATQDVKNYDCSGKLVSTDHTMPRAPRAFYTLPPKNLVNLFQLKIAVTNSAGTLPFTFANSEFWIDAGHGAINSLWVESGANQFDYSFYYCDAWKYDSHGVQTGECLVDLVVRETGTVFMNVVYQEQVLPATENHPDPSTCH